jgi:hypothetical protein
MWWRSEMSQAGANSSSGGGSGTVETLTGNTGGAVGPSSGNINVIGSGGISVTGNPSTNTLTIASSGGSGVTGPVSSTNNAVATWNGTSGSALFSPPSPLISSSGIQTNPNQPAFSAYLSSNQPNVTGANTQYLIPYDMVIFDQGGNFNTSTHLYTFPVTGVYILTTKIFLQGGSAASTLFFGWASYNGAPYPGDRFADLNGASLGLAANGEFIITSTWMRQANAGETVGIFVDVIGGTSNDVSVGGGDPIGCFLYGYLVC